MPVHFKPHAEVGSVRNLVRGHKPRADGRKRVCALAFDPLPAPFRLERAFGDVVDNAVSGDMVQRVFFADIFRFLADHDAEFDFPVCFFGASRKHHVVIRTDDCRSRFAEQNRFFRRGLAGFSCVIGVIQADADHFSDRADARTGSGRSFNDVKAFDVEAVRPRQIGQRVSSNVVDLAGKIADTTGGVEDSGLFFARMSDSQKFHNVSLIF